MPEKNITPEPINAFAGQEFLRTSQFLMVMPINRFVSPQSSREFGMFCEGVEFPGLTTVTTDYRMAGLNRIKVPYSKEYQDVTLSLIHNINSPIYYEFIDWIRRGAGTYGNEIGGIENSTRVPYFDEMVANFKLHQLTDISDPNSRFGGLSKILSNIDKLNARLLNSENVFNTTRTGQSFISNFNSVTTDRAPRKIYYTVEFYNAFPTALQSIQSNWADDGFQRINVSFTYEYFRISRPMSDDYERG